MRRDVKFLEDKCWNEKEDDLENSEHEEILGQPTPPLWLPILHVKGQEEQPTNSSSSSENESSARNHRKKKLRDIYEGDNDMN